ncbi:MAG TPA: ATP-binding protein [Aquabacterium sp.]|uniref:ATP-binding protein n=1 Tax=Aquabacterium sp. TaxID=1872578 RepID=UPI002E2F830B|nr:ATP-binding protein [Aquabacterium sp.]HEX5372180.1 ATP-binding protein [Aquabacterium sp.]
MFHPPAVISPPSTRTLEAQIQAARLRMSFGHVPAASLTGAGFAVLIAMLVAHLRPTGLDPGTGYWLSALLLVAALRTGHAIAYLRTRDRTSRYWQPTFLVLTLLIAFCWGALVWMLPLHESTELMTAMVGSVTGIAATGVAMLHVDRISARAWLTPILLSTVVYCLWQGGPFGLFGGVSVGGFMVVLWFSTGRSHRRTGELLRLRFAGEELAEARTQALREAEELSAAKGRFLATMSHEMRTPLHGILGLARILQGDVVSRDAHQRLHLLQGTGHLLLGVINDVLDFSRLQEGLMELRPRATHLPNLVRDVCALSNVTAQDKGLDIRMHCDLPADHWVEVDADRLQQVLINLVGNAVKFTEHGHIQVTVRQAESTSATQARITFEVQDSGIGIPPHEISRIFEAFHQVDGRYERRSSGSGLGLSIARQICRTMDSDIACQSVVGQGSTFSFTLDLPCARDPGTAPESAPPQCDQQSPLPNFDGTVLLVEDNPVNTLVAQAELEQLGLSVATVVNGRQALRWLASHQADLVLMDCHMPEMDGFEATRQIRASEARLGARRTPVVALTASAQSEDLRLCRDAGMDDHVSKPFTPADLRRVLRLHLGRPAAASPLSRAGQGDESTVEMTP